jgi:hypothetical protein
MPKSRETARANLENLYRIFTVPEAPDSTLGAIDQAITDNLTGFLQTHIVALERDIEEIEADFSASAIPEDPTFVSEYTEFVKEKLVAQSVHTAAPGFIGHMTSALPYFMLPLSRIMTALNQNLVKVETSKAFTPMERQVLAMLHRLVYRGDDAFYGQWIHNSRHALGAFCSGGTIANVTALWVARNRLFAPAGQFRGIAQEGLARSLKHLGCDGIAVLVSRRGHYSFGKAADLLGIGRDNLVMVETDANNRIDLNLLKQECRRLQEENIRPLALVGIAGPPKPAMSIPWRRWPTLPPSSAAIFMSMPPGAGRPSFRTATATCSAGSPEPIRSPSMRTNSSMCRWGRGWLSSGTPRPFRPSNITPPISCVMVPRTSAAIPSRGRGRARRCWCMPGCPSSDARGTSC